MEKMLAISSEKIASYPKVTLLLCLMIVGCFSIGFVFAKIENRSSKIFVPQESQGIKDLNKAEKHFDLNIRQEDIILVPKSDEKLLSAKCFKDALMIHQKVVSLSSYSKMCATLSGTMGNSSGRCMFINPVEIFAFQERNFVNMTSQLRVASLCPSPLIMSNGRPSCQNMNRMFGNDRKNISNIADVQAMRLIYFLKDSDEDYVKLIAWEKSFLDMLSSIQKNMACAKILSAAERSLDDAIDDSSGSDVSLLGRCLQKIPLDQAEAIVVMPKWPTQAYCTKAMKMLVPATVLLSKRVNLLRLPTKPDKQYPLLAKLQLVACRLSGNGLKSMQYVESLATCSWARGEKELKNNKRHSSIDGWITVVQNKLIVFVPL